FPFDLVGRERGTAFARILRRWDAVERQGTPGMRRRGWAKKNSIWIHFGYFSGKKPMEEFIHKDETYRIIGACFEVYKEKGRGFLEAVYQECLEIELELQGIPFVARQPLPLEYK